MPYVVAYVVPYVAESAASSAGKGGSQPMIEVSDWHVRGNEVRRVYRITQGDGAEPILFEIHCTLSEGFFIDMFVNLRLRPGPIQQESSLERIASRRRR
jgi:hypothetical protein